MGSSTSEQGKVNATTNNEWIRYTAQLSKDKVSPIEPFYTQELSYLEELFGNLDKKNLKSLELKDFDDIITLKTNPFYFRIKELFE